MTDSGPASFFGEEQAAGYDERWVKTAPMSDGLHFLMRMVLADLPREARILCVGAGTGSELMALARTFPQWHFTAVEPSGPMLEVCRKKVDAAGYTSRCEFHGGYIDSLPPTQPFDAATSILVSQFLTKREQRQDFFHQIERRLRPRAYLINADLTAPVQGEDYDSLIDVWLRTHDEPAANKVSCAEAWGKLVAVSSLEEVESIIAAAGFDHPIPFYQALFIQAWYTRVRSEED